MKVGKKLTFTILLLTLSGLFSCDPCRHIGCVYPEVEVEIVNSNGENVFDASDSLFNEVELRIFDVINEVQVSIGELTHKNTVAFAALPQVIISYGASVPNDTLELSFSTFEQDCCTRLKDLIIHVNGLLLCDNCLNEDIKIVK